MMRSWTVDYFYPAPFFCCIRRFPFFFFFQTLLHSTVLLILLSCFFLFVHVSRPITGFPAEPDEKQKEIQNNSISEGKDWAVTVLATSGRIIQMHSDHCALSLLCSQVCRRLPRPVVRGDGASRQRGASQCGGVSVCLQGGPGLRRPGDSGLRHEGEKRQKHTTLVLK